jgi:hypothetical protein
MRGRYTFGGRQVGYGARHTQYAVVRARRQVELPGRLFEQTPARIVCITERCQRISLEARIADGRALFLQLPRLLYAAGNDRACFAVRLRGSQRLRRRSRNFDVQVDAVEQRARDAGGIT